MPYKDQSVQREKGIARAEAWKARNPEKAKEVIKKGNAKYISLNPEKHLAHYTLQNAVQSGRVVRPDTCRCGNPNPEGHHEDYSRPLMVSWLCSKCHHELHKSRRGGV
jgi:hypothetical protein